MNRRFCLICVVLCLSSPVLAQPMPRDYRAELPRISPTEPAEALRTFKVHPGFHVELVASEPLIRSPVAIDFDENGRMFVAEFPEYNQYANKSFKGHGCIKVLEDTKGTGRFDKTTIYADNIDSPVALICYNGGVFVGAPPFIYYFKDTKGDGKADLRQTVFTGFGKDEAGEAMLNSFRWGLDNRIHLSTSLSGGNVRRADKADAKPVSVRHQGFAFDPRTYAFQLTSGGGQHGMSMDDWGSTFVCGNSDPIQQIVYESRYLAGNPYLHAPSPVVDIAQEGKFTKLHRLSPNEPWRVLRTRLRSQGLVAGSDEGGQPSGFFTGATGVTIYRGSAWPEEYRGNAFIGEVANNLVYRARLEPNGITFLAKRADPDAEFLASTDNWFRPVQFANAPDGTLYVIDMYREFIEAAVSVPPDILKHLDVSSGVDRGRVYRIVPDGFKQPEPPRLGKATTAELVALLEHANGWHRDTAARLLYERQDKAAVARFKMEVRHNRFPLGRLHVLYALQGLSALDADLVHVGLYDSDPRIREHSVRLSEYFEDVDYIRARLANLAKDADIRVRYQLAFTLGLFSGDMPARALAELALRDAGDRWMRLAIICSANGRENELFRLLSEEKAFRSTPAGKDLLTALAGHVDAGVLEDTLASLPTGENPLARSVVLSFVSPLSLSDRAHLKGSTARIFKELVEEARRTGLGAGQSPESRSQAVLTLRLVPLKETEGILTGLLDIHQPQPVQKTVLEALATYEESEVPAIILKAWASLSPGLRATATETLLSRPKWINSFFAAIEEGTIKPADISPARVQLLRASPDSRVRELSAKHFATAQLSKRQDVLAAYQKALDLKGDTAKGKVLFKNMCSSCHRLEGVGESVGAELSAVRDRGSAFILLSVLDPNREVQPQYIAYTVATTKGRFLTGMVVAETANSLTIRRSDGTSETVARADIEQLKSTGLSFMPEGLEKQISVEGMADLLAYLNSIH
jgi:putative membrane-bound dehydrogenase-like protein